MLAKLKHRSQNIQRSFKGYGGLTIIQEINPGNCKIPLEY